MESPFIPPEVCNNAQLCFLTVAYGLVLYQGSNLISSGSEFLLLVPSIAGLIGSIVLPILGAVPDGMMVLFSGLGPNAQEEVSVGVGALAGSTVMLLTFPWFIAIMFGAVPLKDGAADYTRVAPEVSSEGAPTTAPPKGGLFNSGISFDTSIRKTAAIMLGTTCIFLIIQVPAALAESLGVSTSRQAQAENIFALIGVLVSIAAFGAYLIFCYFDASEDKQVKIVVKAIKDRKMSLGAALKFIKKTTATPCGAGEKLLPIEEKRMNQILMPFYTWYIDEDTGKLELQQFKRLLKDLGEHVKTGPARTLFNEHDKDKSGEINFEEFTECVKEYLADSKLDKMRSKQGRTVVAKALAKASNVDDQGEEEEVPLDLADLPPSEQQFWIIFRASYLMGAGTLLVLVFSDPAVDVLAEWGARLNVSPFYVSFVLAPFASNASELLAAYTYAIKKSKKSITTSLSTLVGAACMNNTFCLGIFFALIYFKELAWQFSAETAAIVLVQWIIGLLAIARKTQSKFMGVLILMCYPLCLFLVWFLENEVGWD